MENKKLINILLKDMNELEGLISDLKGNNECDLLELEIIHSKAKGIKYLLEVLNERNINEPVKVKPTVVEKEDLKQGFQAQPEVVEEEIEEEVEEVEQDTNEPEQETIQDEIRSEEEIKDKPADEVEESNFVEEEQKEVEEEPDVREENEQKEVVEEKPVAPEENMQTEAVEEEIKAKANVEESSDEVELQEPEEDDSAKILGDKFQKGKSVNDLISENTNTEQKFSKLPILSIKSAIGINDRFLFTRELFEGDAGLYTQSVEKLDGLNNINEAVSFLRDNFKWKKNETSLKFIDLVKRRFQNE